MSTEILPIYLAIGGALLFAALMGLALWLGGKRFTKEPSSKEICGCPLFVEDKPQGANGTSHRAFQHKEVCPFCCGNGKQPEEVHDSADLQVANCEKCGGSGEITQYAATNYVTAKSESRRMFAEWEIWSWKGLLSTLTIFEVLTQSPLFILYLVHGDGPMESLTFWHYVSVLGAMVIIPLLLATIPLIALVVGILSFLGFLP